ncbi:MAG: response regulator transcription factor [Actinomycetota bacterium]
MVLQVPGSAAAEQAMTRIVIVEDHTLVRQSVAKIVSAEPGFIVVGEAARGDEVLPLVNVRRPHIVLLDVAIPGGSGLEVAAQLRAEAPAVRLIFLTMHDDDATVSRAVALGADGYLLKSASTDELIQGLRAVAAGGSFLSPAVARSVMRRAGGRAQGTCLTDRELEVLQLLVSGRRPAEVARTLFVSLKTVRNHLANIYMKLDVDTAAQAIAEAFRQGLVAQTF